MKCTFCGTESSAFKPFGLSLEVLRAKDVVGGGFRPNALCPCCGSLDRERLIEIYLRTETAIFSTPTTLLHVAPERCLTRVLRACPSIRYVSVDVGSRAAMVRMDITQMAFDSDFFDAVICNHVLEHVSSDSAALHELYRVLKLGGWAILQVPIALALEQTLECPSITSREERARLYGQPDHVRLYGRDYPDRLKQFGFDVVTFNALERLGPETVATYALLREERIYVARKLDH